MRFGRKMNRPANLMIGSPTITAEGPTKERAPAGVTGAGQLTDLSPRRNSHDLVASGPDKSGAWRISPIPISTVVPHR